MYRRPCPQSRKIFKTESPDEAQASAVPPVQVADQSLAETGPQLPSRNGKQSPDQVADHSPDEIAPVVTPVQVTEQSPDEMTSTSPYIERQSEIAQRPRRVNAGIHRQWLMDVQVDIVGKNLKRTIKATKTQPKTTVSSPKLKTKKKNR